MRRGRQVLAALAGSMRVREDRRAFVERVGRPLAAKVARLASMADDVTAVHSRVHATRVCAAAVDVRDTRQRAQPGTRPALCVGARVVDCEPR